MGSSKKLHIVDSHTGGEPTRIVISGGPELGSGSLSLRLNTFRNEWDHFRSAVVNEPRGSDAIVGALLCGPLDPTCAAGVIFFNNAGYLGMCGHGTIGLVVTLAYLGTIRPGIHRIETPVGVVEGRLHESGKVTVTNVPSYRYAAGISVDLQGFGAVIGDVAWGGNWFFLTEDCPFPVALENEGALTDYARRIRDALRVNGLTGAGGSEIDHIELSGPPTAAHAHSRNFVLCPGGSYDRSPCGTGTSAKLACLYELGRLGEGEIWRQESITGSIFEGSFALKNGTVYPSITGSAFVNAEGSLILDERDPLCWGICKLGQPVLEKLSGP
ncbi:MAG: proline racemase family protein [Acidobacteriota bacterium]|nr:proline racemase family protein [Acidobacteriota bacterium]